MESCSKEFEFASGTQPKSRYLSGEVTSIPFTLVAKSGVSEGEVFAATVQNWWWVNEEYIPGLAVGGRRLNFSVSNPAAFDPGTHEVTLRRNINGDDCTLWQYTVDTSHNVSSVYAVQDRVINGETKQCYARSGMGCIQTDLPFAFVVKDPRIGAATYGGRVQTTFNAGTQQNPQFIIHKREAAGVTELNFSPYSSSIAGSHDYYVISLTPQDQLTGKFNEGVINLATSCDQCLDHPPSNNIEAKKYRICEQIDKVSQSIQYDQCLECIEGEEGIEGIWTAVGCIKRDPVQIVQVLVKLGLGMGGGLALIVILAAGFILSTSQGDPKRVGEAKEWLTAAITGLLLVIFSVVLLRFIGFSVLRIPGFGG